MLVNETFGPTFQGEGPLIGSPCTFLRLALCNQSCSFCDTPYTWNWDEYDPNQEVKTFDFQQVAYGLLNHGLEDNKHLVISGGEPMLQQVQFMAFVAWLGTYYPYIFPARSLTVEVETAGTIAPRALFGYRYNVSPKLENSGNPAHTRFRPKALKVFRELHSTFKFVVSDPADFKEIDSIVSQIEIPRASVYVMPEGITQEDVLEHARMVAQEVIKRGWNLTTRLHVELYGNTRGV